MAILAQNWHQRADLQSEHQFYDDLCGHGSQTVTINHTHKKAGCTKCITTKYRPKMRMAVAQVQLAVAQWRTKKDLVKGGAKCIGRAKYRPEDFCVMAVIQVQLAVNFRLVLRI